MITETHEDTELDVDLDKHIPCQSIRKIGDLSWHTNPQVIGCPNPAEWMTICSTKFQILGKSVFLCTPHKINAEKLPHNQVTFVRI